MESIHSRCDENLQCDLPAKRICCRDVDGRSVRPRVALGDLTNIAQKTVLASKYDAKIFDQTKLTANAIVLQPTANVVLTRCECGDDTKVDVVHEQATVAAAQPSRKSTESGYGGSDTEQPSAKRVPSARNVVQQCQVPPALASKLSKVGPTGRTGRRGRRPIDESEIDRRPFKPKLACDIVRAAFADRIQLEELLEECRRTDFSVSALDRSPFDRMMEATDYIVSIMAYEQSRESKDYYQLGDFLASHRQANLTPDMLATLADWLVEVQEIFAFNHETVHLAWGLLYAYFDRGQSLPRREIQLMACAAIMVACKHEENRMLPITEFLYITDGAYKREDFIEAERRLLVAIDFAVHRPNAYVFLRRYARVLDAHSGLVQYMSRFLLEAGMHSHGVSVKRESLKAAAVLWLSRVILRNPSYMDWARRKDVRQLRHYIRSHPRALAYYESCTSGGLKTHTTPASNSSGQRTCPQSGALDLRTHSLTPSTSRTDSLTHNNPRLGHNLNEWMERSKALNPILLDRTISEPPPASSSSSDGDYQRVCSSAPVEYCRTPDPVDELGPELDSLLKQDMEAMRTEECQRAPYWPPILQHITGYKERDLIPLAIRYHLIALRLIAEVARGGHLAKEQALDPQKETRLACTAGLEVRGDFYASDDENSESASRAQRSVSPGGHHLRRQSVTKYCSNDFLNVADAYPQLAFENFVPHFPAVQCPEKCRCFVCVNLLQR